MDHDTQPPAQPEAGVAPLLLDKLPVEVLAMVAKNLAPCDLDNYPKSRHQLDQNKPYEDLRNLCLVSKKLGGIAHKVLFENVIIRRSSRLVMLYRTLLENQHVSGYIKNMVLDTTFSRKGAKYERIDLRLLSGLDPDFDYWSQPWPIRMSRSAEGELISGLYLRILNRTLGIETLAINVPAVSYHGYEDAELSDSRDFPPDQTDTRIDSPYPVQQPVLARLPKLNTVRLLGCPDGMDDHLPMQMESLMSCRWRQQPSLERLIWIKDGTSWFSSLPFQHDRRRMYGPNWKCDKIKVLDLQGSRCFPKDIADICESFPDLRVLSVVSSRDRTLSRFARGENPTFPMGANSLTSSLEKLQHIEVLRLDLHCHKDIRPILGPENTLRLSGLTKLQSLAVPIQYFMSGNQQNQQPVMKNPGMVLPQSLRSLTLLAGVENLWDALKTSRTRALKPLQGTVLDFLEALYALRLGHFSDLMRVTYLYSDSAEKIEDGDPCNCNGPRVRCRYHDAQRVLSLSKPLRRSPARPEERFRALVEEFAEQNVQLNEDYTMVHTSSTLCHVRPWSSLVR